MRKKLATLKKKLEFAAVAVTYAEAGEWGTAEDYLKKIEALNKSSNPKMLVVALDKEFTSETIEYTINLAERMHFDLLAVNALQPSKHRSLFKGRKNSRLKDGMKHLFSSLVEKAQVSNIHCETIVTLKDFRIQIRNLLKQIRRVELVLVQVDQDQEISLNLGVPVFQIAAAGSR
jgi:hypothetical protein